MSKSSSRSAQHAMSMLKNLDSMRKDSQNCDFTIKVGSEEFPIHKYVVAAGSDYFKAMLAHDTVETKSGILDLKEVDAGAVKRCIDYIYSGEYVVEIGEEFEVFKAAHLLQIQDLCEEIVISLSEELDCDSFVETRKLALKYNLEELESKCDLFALDNLSGISSMDWFKDLDKEFVRFLIKSPNFKFTVGFRLKLLLQWINSDKENRETDFSRMLKDVDLLEVSLSYRKYLMENEPLICESLENYKVFANTFIDCLKVSSADLESNDSATDPKVILVFDKISSSLKIYDPLYDKWTTLQGFKMPNLDWFSAVVVDHSIFVMSEKSLFSLNCLNPKGCWIERRSMLEDCGLWLPAVVMNGDIYVVGKERDKDSFAEKYIVATDEWVKIPSRPSKIYDFSLAVCKGSLYCIGGGDEKGCSKVVQKYDPQINLWTDVASMKSKRQYPAVTTVNDIIYVVGGYCVKKLNTGESYDPTQNVWTAIASMQIPRYRFRLCPINGKIYAVGGRGETSKEEKVVEVYDIGLNKWQTSASYDGMDLVLYGSLAIRLH